MRPAEFTTEQIIAAGEQLLAAGRNVTGFGLRQVVGGGHATRLRQVWEEHLASKRTAQAEPVAELPVEVAEAVAMATKTLTERITAFAVELNDKAVKAAERRVGEVVRAAGEQREQAERELADAAQTVEELEQQLNGVHTEGEALRQRLTKTSDELHQHQIELAQLRERHLATENAARLADAAHLAEVQKLNDQLDELRAGHARATAAASAAEDAHQAHRKEMAKEAQRCADKLIAVEAARDQLATEATQATAALARAEGQIDTLKEQNAKLLAAMGGKLKGDGGKP